MSVRRPWLGLLLVVCLCPARVQAAEGRLLVSGLSPLAPPNVSADAPLQTSASPVPRASAPKRTPGPALDTSATEAQTMYNEALVQLAAGQRLRAEDLLHLALTTSPGYVRAHFALGTLLDGDGHPADSIREFEAALAAEPGHPRLLTNYGIALMHAGRLDDSDIALQKAIGLEPHSPYAFNAQGLLREKQRRYDDAVASFKQALAADDGFTAAHVNLGLLALSQRRVNDAESEFALAGDTSADALNGLGVLRWFEGHTDQAEQLFSQALVADRGNLTAQYNLALYLTSLGRYQEAMYHLAGLEADPDLQAQALTLRGVIERQQGHLDLAGDALQKAVSLNPALVSAQALLGLVALESGDLDLAQLHLQAARDLDPKDAVVHNDLALVWRRKGKLGNAIEELEQAAAVAPDVADIQYNLGYLYDESGHGDVALPHLKRYLELSPHAADASSVQQRITELSKLKKKKAP